MLEHTFVRTGVTARLRWSPLGPYLDALATSLHHEGYPPSSIQRFLCAAEKCAQWAQRQGDAFGEMDEDLLQRYLSRLPRYRSGNLPKAAQGLGSLVRSLQQHGVTRPRQAGLPIPPIDQWLSAYGAQLEHVAGIALSTRQTYGRLVKCFLTDSFGAEPPNWPSLTPARAILAEIDTEMRHVGSAARLASWAGMCPGNDESAGKRHSGRLRKGNRDLRRVLVPCASAARKTPTFLGHTCRRLEGRLGGKKAAMAVAHTMLVIGYYLLLEGMCDEEERYDH